MQKNYADLLQSIYNNGHTIIIATARDNVWHSDPENITKQWLDNNKIPYHKLYIGRVDKENICEIENADVFIDDDIEITSRVANKISNIKVFLSQTDYNQTLTTPKNVKQIKNLSDLSSLLNLPEFNL